MVTTTIEAMPDFRVPYIGNYENTADPRDVRLTNRWDPMTKLLQAGRWGIAVWLPMLWLAAVGLGTTAAVRWRSDPLRRSLGLVAALIGTTAILTAVAVPIGDGYMELPKHTVLVVWLTAPLLAAAGVAVGYGLNLGIRRLSGSDLTTEGPEVPVDVPE